MGRHEGVDGADDLVFEMGESARAIEAASCAFQLRAREGVALVEGLAEQSQSALAQGVRRAGMGARQRLDLGVQRLAVDDLRRLGLAGGAAGGGRWDHGLAG